MSHRIVRLALLAVALSWLFPLTAQAQTMQQVLDRLFVFAGGDDPLFLAGSAGLPSTEVHGAHFIPSESEANLPLLQFFNQAISSNIANFPLSSTVSSQTVTFVGGVPTPTAGSFGPIFAERAQTVGRGRFSTGISFSRLRFSRMRGENLDDLRLTFVHQNADFPTCDDIFGGDCSDLGVPQFEHDVIELDMDLDIEADVFAVYATVGVTNWLDVGFAVPIIDFRLDGSSTARILPTTGTTALHFFGGTPENPVLEATTRASGETTGIGDIAFRAKTQILQSQTLDFALLGEIRAPTGRTEDFLGTGETNARGLFIASGAFGDFSPHINVGYAYRGSELEANAIETVAGFDHRLSPWATLAVDLLGAFQIGDERINFPQPLTIPVPYRQTVERTNIPDRRDHIVDGAFGFKFRTQGGVVIVANALVALNDGGLRADVIPTLAIEYAR